MGEKDIKNENNKRVLIFIIIVLVLLGIIFLKKYFNEKREREIGDSIRSTLSDTETTWDKLEHEEIDESSGTEETENIESEDVLDKVANHFKSNEEIGTKEENNDIIDKFEWDYDEDNKLTIGLFKDKTNGNLSVSVFGHYSNENIGLMQESYIWIFALSYSCGIESNVMCTVGEDSYMLLMNDGKILSNTFPEDVKDIPESYLDSVKEMHTALEEFYVKNGLKEKFYNQFVYEDENVKIYFTGIDNYGVNFNVENLTDKQVMIQADSIAINGISTNSIIMSDDVEPNSTGKVVAKCDDFYSKTEIEKISGVLRVIGIKDLGYEAVFSDITVE